MKPLPERASPPFPKKLTRRDLTLLVCTLEDNLAQANMLHGRHVRAIFRRLDKIEKQLFDEEG